MVPLALIFLEKVMVKCSCESLRQMGYSYLMVLFMVFLMGVSVSVASTVYYFDVRREKEKELLFVGEQFSSAIKKYYDVDLPGGRHEYPGALNDLLLDKRSVVVQRYIRQIYVDPMTGNADWGVKLVNGGIACVYSLSNLKPIKVANFGFDIASFSGANSYSDWTFCYPKNLMQPSGV